MHESSMFANSSRRRSLLVDVELELGISTVFWVVSAALRTRLHTGAALLVDVELELGISTVFWVVSAALRTRLHTGAALLVDVELVFRVVTSAGAANSSERGNYPTTCEASSVRICGFSKRVTALCSCGNTSMVSTPQPEAEEYPEQ